MAMVVVCLWRAWEACEKGLRRFLQKRLGDAGAAEDVLHDIFLKAARQEHGFCEIKQPRAWLFRLARNELANWHRHSPAAAPLPENLAAPQAEILPLVTLEHCLPQALAALDADDRDAIEHCELAGMSQRDYANLRGLGLSAAKSRVQRARGKMRQFLVRQCGVRFDEQTHQVCCHVPPASAG
ncbi:MAG TPA: sigma-70 family RNA polymerase sigma factor [Acidocella sp.]|nr:sigma-70 family RNA polymerase sigma factor [Acidocella sp.]